MTFQTRNEVDVFVDSSSPAGSNKAMMVMTASSSCAVFWPLLNDILIPHLKSLFVLNYAQVMLVQFSFFSAFLIFSYPSGKLVERFGSQKTLVGGLFTMGTGALLFLPASQVPSFVLFMIALVVLAAGVTALQVSGNPYVSVLGPAARVEQAQSDAGLQLSWIDSRAHIWRHSDSARGGLRGRGLRKPALWPCIARLQGATGILCAEAIYIDRSHAVRARSYSRVSETSGNSQYREIATGQAAEPVELPARHSGHRRNLSLLRRRNYHRKLPGELHKPAQHWRDDSAICRGLRLYLLGRIDGRPFRRFRSVTRRKNRDVSRLQRSSRPCTGDSHHDLYGHVAMWTILLVGVFNSIMFPSLFTLGIANLGALTGKASGVLMSGAVGAAVIPVVQGMVADRIGVHSSFLVPAICYLYVAFYGLKGCHLSKQD